MEFVPQPEGAKKFGSVKWLKWQIYKNPATFIMISLVPYFIYKAITVPMAITKGMNDGTYVPNVLMNRYAVCRPDDWPAQNTPKRYRN